MKLVYLSGGVGGARLLMGLHDVMPARSLTVVVNTADDFDHWGLRICPDLDTVMYNLAGVSHPERGWGLAHETFEALSRMRTLGADDWFLLSDQDLATHLRRNELLRSGLSLTETTASLALALGVERPLLPMTDADVHTIIQTQDGRALPFQQWFVRERCAPIVGAVELAGSFRDNPAVLAALREADAVLIGPSNPYVSIDPMLHGVQTRELLRHKPCFAVSPIVGGKAIKGPLAEMMASLTKETASAKAIAEHYLRRWQLPLRGVVVHVGDGWNAGDVAVRETNTIMKTHQDRIQLAEQCLDFITRELGQ